MNVKMYRKSESMSILFALIILIYFVIQSVGEVEYMRGRGPFDCFSTITCNSTGVTMGAAGTGKAVLTESYHARDNHTRLLTKSLKEFLQTGSIPLLGFCLLLCGLLLQEGTMPCSVKSILQYIHNKDGKK